MGYYYTDDELPGCAFRYSYYPYYDASGAATAARMDIARVERVAIPHLVERGDWASADRTQPDRGWGNSAESAVGVVSERETVMPPAPAAAPPAPRVVAPRN